MAFTEFETERYKHLTEIFVESKRPPEHIRGELDIIYELKNQSITIYELRQDFMDHSKMLKIEVVKITYVRSANVWRLYWQRRDLKWYSYDPDPEVDTLEEALQIVKNDDLGCFWG